MSTPEMLSRESPDWPEFAPAWAESASFDPAAGIVTFARSWTMPGIFREMEPLVIVKIEQVYWRGSGDKFYADPARVAAGPDALWADHRTEHVAATLREIADALAPEVSNAEVTA